MTVRLFRVALVALVLAERPLAVLSWHFMQLPWKASHAVGDELRGLDVSVADRAVHRRGSRPRAARRRTAAVVRKGMATVQPFMPASNHF